MSAQNHYLAIFLGTPDSPRMAAWNALPEAEQQKKRREGIALWEAWGRKHSRAIVAMGGPLGKTKNVSAAGIKDRSNAMTAYTIVQAESAEAAAKLFENHPHFTHFPGESIDVMPIMPVPGA